MNSNENANRNHKSSVFSTLFSNPEILREVYSAIEGVDIPKDAIVNINTLTDVLFMNQINDLSFTIDDRIVVLIEHQSTICNNVPVRLLMYIGRVYEKILEREKLYQKKQVKIPTPEFIVLYNGAEDYPDYNEIKLSDAFKNVSGLKLSDEVLPLELFVKVYNINHGRNPEKLARSKTLENYSIFIGKINEYKKKLTLEKSIKAAVKYCIEQDILKQFLKNHASEIFNMLSVDISLDELAATRYNEGLEDGHAQGHAQGHVQGREEGRGERDKYFLALLDQGLSTEEIKQRLHQTTNC